MVDYTVKYKKYKVIMDSGFNFKPGEIVVALQNDNCPLCVRERDFKGPGVPFSDYPDEMYHVMYIDELEEVTS